MSVEKTIIDGSGRQVELHESDFKLVQHDKKIYDVKFKNKPTTFFKDALRRFVKSKPALVGFIVVGILFLTSLVVPMCTPDVGVYNVNPDGGGDRTIERGLVPKLFDAGTGFWDGTIKRTGILYDKENEAPVGYKENTYYNLVTYDRVVNNFSSPYANGGSVNFYNLSTSNPGYFYSELINFDFSNEYTITYNLSSEQYSNYVKSGYKLYLHQESNLDLEHSFTLHSFEPANEGNYESLFGTWTGVDDLNNEITIVINEPNEETLEGSGTFGEYEFTYTYDSENPNTINCAIDAYSSLSFTYTYDSENITTSLSVSYTEFDLGTNYYLVGDKDTYETTLTNTINVNEVLSEYNLKTLEADLRFELPASESRNTPNYILISDFNITSNNDEINPTLSAISFKDGNEALIRTGDVSGVWSTNSTANKTGYGVNATYCDFTWDQYEDAYGLTTVTFGPRQLTEYISNGSLVIHFDTTGTNETSDPEVLSARFEVVDPERCPIISVTSQVGNAVLDDLNPANGYTGYQIYAEAYQYRLLGYDEMPRFIFGTNDSSKNYFKLIFTGLRFSLLFALGVSIVNIIIGLVWGSISGYYGGWVDIGMERICDILGGLPTTVLITLVIMYGNQFNWGNSSDVIALMISIFLTGWMGVARQTRTQFYRFKGREYVLASRTLGAKDRRLIFKHILPNSAGTIITGSVLIIPSVMYTEASIAYLGLGLQNQVMFGVILSEANSYYTGDKTFLLIIPTIIMILLLVSFNLFGNGLRDAFNPSLKGGEK